MSTSWVSSSFLHCPSWSTKLTFWFQVAQRSGDEVPQNAIKGEFEANISTSIHCALLPLSNSIDEFTFSIGTFHSISFQSPFCWWFYVLEVYRSTMNWPPRLIGGQESSGEVFQIARANQTDGLAFPYLSLLLSIQLVTLLYDECMQPMAATLFQKLILDFKQVRSPRKVWSYYWTRGFSVLWR